MQSEKNLLMNNEKQVIMRGTVTEFTKFARNSHAFRKKTVNVDVYHILRMKPHLSCSSNSQLIYGFHSDSRICRLRGVW